MTPDPIVLATRNPGKLREIQQVLGSLAVRVEGLAGATDVAEPAEEGMTFAENARAKSLYYARATGLCCLADDSGLVVDALGGAPGVRSARYAADRCPPGADRPEVEAANNAKLLAELQGIPDACRTARFECHVALADPQRILIETTGTVEGWIAREPRGTDGFGYDPLFYLPDLGRTMAELSPEAKNGISHRGQAVRRFAALLGDLLTRRSR